MSGNANVLGGVLIHKVTQGDANSSYLLDMTPATTSWSDSALPAGQTYTDPVSVQVKDPAGSITTLSGTTDSTGSAYASYTMKPRMNKTGTYTVTSQAIMGSTSSTATTSFVVQ